MAYCIEQSPTKDNGKLNGELRAELYVLRFWFEQQEKIRRLKPWKISTYVDLLYTMKWVNKSVFVPIKHQVIMK